MPPPRPRLAGSLAFLGGVLLVASHVLTPKIPNGDTILFGWLPVEVAARLAWVGLAFAYLLFFTTACWRDGGPE